ncbi:MAG: DegT/DnrJ/EryC1/StrS family aminotransferase, partial [Helicobacter sp.]|nr:DegT/DnrJ/EryC1/StrS family aminotransferase [Helicobacter sp.]
VRNKHISQGYLTYEFEEKLAEFLNVPYVVCVSSGSAALALSYIVCGLKPGDSILTSNVTFVATANASLLLGGKVEAVDVNKRNVMDVESLEKSLSKQTKIIVPVHMNGCAVEMESVLEIAKKYGLSVVEDACQAFGCRYSYEGSNKGKYLGTFGRFGCFSLGMAKLLTTGGGGFVVAHTQEDYDLLCRARNQGVLDVRKERIYKNFGFNFKYTDLQASIGLNQLKNIHKKLNSAKENYLLYKQRLGDKLTFLESLEGEIPMRVVVLTPKNQEIYDYLLSKNIQCALESQPLSYCEYLGIKGEFKASDYFEQHKLILPSGPSKSKEEINKVCDEILRFKEL